MSAPFTMTTVPVHHGDSGSSDDGADGPSPPSPPRTPSPSLHHLHYTQFIKAWPPTGNKCHYAPFRIAALSILLFKSSNINLLQHATILLSSGELATHSYAVYISLKVRYQSRTIDKMAQRHTFWLLLIQATNTLGVGFEDDRKYISCTP